MDSSSSCPEQKNMPQINRHTKALEKPRAEDSEPHHHLLLRMFSKHSPQPPTLLTFQKHRMAHHRLPIAATMCLVAPL